MKKLVVIFTLVTFLFSGCGKNEFPFKDTIDYDTEGLKEFNNSRIGFYSSEDFVELDDDSGIIYYGEGEQYDYIFVYDKTFDEIEEENVTEVTVTDVNSFVELEKSQFDLMFASTDIDQDEAGNILPKSELEIAKEDYSIRGIDAYKVEYKTSVSNYDDLSEVTKSYTQEEPQFMYSYMFNIPDGILFVQTSKNLDNSDVMEDVLNTVYIKDVE